MILEGIELGIYSYFLLPKDIQSVKLSLELAAANRDCAFCLLLPEGLQEKHKQELAQCTLCPNTLVGINSCSAGLDKADSMAEEPAISLSHLPYLRCG